MLRGANLPTPSGGTTTVAEFDSLLPVLCLAASGCLGADMISAPPPCGRSLRQDAHWQVQTFGARRGGCEGLCRPRGPVVGGPVVSGTFVLPSPPAVSPALGTGECWLRRRDSRPHVSQYAGAQDLLAPPPTIAPRTRSPTLGIGDWGSCPDAC